MVKQKESALSNAKIAIIFFVLLGLIVGISLVFKIILVVKDGKFDDSRRFNLSVSNNKNIEVISFSPETKTISVFKLDKNIKSSDAGRFLEIPIDGVISADSLDLNQEVNPIFLKAILNYSSLQTNLTIIDLLKISFFAKSVPQRDIKIEDIAYDLRAVDIDRIVGRLAGDELIKKDNKTIQIINGTDIIGLGNRLARLITNMGGDVIIVATSDKPQKKSKISYIDKKTYTVERLSKILEYEIAKIEENPIADITITIGEDRLNSSKF